MIEFSCLCGHYFISTYGYHVQMNMIFSLILSESPSLNRAVGSASAIIGGCRSVVSLSSIKGSRCFPEQETSPSLLSTGWFQERTRA